MFLEINFYNFLFMIYGIIFNNFYETGISILNINKISLLLNY